MSPIQDVVQRHVSTDALDLPNVSNGSPRAQQRWALVGLPYLTGGGRSNALLCRSLLLCNLSCLSHLSGDPLSFDGI